MFTLTPMTILIGAAVAMLIVAALATLRAWPKTPPVSFRPAAVAFGLAVVLFGIAAFTA